jgi:hypothetical protein
LTRSVTVCQKAKEVKFMKTRNLPLMLSATLLLIRCSSSAPETAGSDGGSSGDAPGNEGSSAVAAGPGDAPSMADTSVADVSVADVSTYVDQVAPTPPSSWVNVTHNLAGMASECGNLTLVSSHPADDMLIAGVALHGLWASTDGAASWHSIGTGAGSAVITNRPSSIVYDPAHKDVFWESGIYNGTGVYVTTDNGTSFAGLGTTHHNDSVSVDFNDPMRQTLLAGPHEQKQMLFLSTNGGSTWKDIGPNLPAGTSFCTHAVVFDPKTFLVGCSGWGGGTDGIFRSTDGGGTWKSVSTASAANNPLRAADGAIYWPIIYDKGLLKSTDQGQSWTQIVSSGVMHTVSPIELPDHRLATAGFQKIILSGDGGKTWNPVGDALPYAPETIAYSAFRRAFYVSHSTCSNNVPADAIEELGFDYTKQ